MDETGWDSGALVAVGDEGNAGKCRHDAVFEDAKGERAGNNPRVVKLLLPAEG